MFETVVNATEKQGQVSEQLSYVAGNLDNLERLIVRLEEKLSPILSGNEGKAELTENKKAGPLVELANQISKVSSGIAVLSDRVDSIIRRIEI